MENGRKFGQNPGFNERSRSNSNGQRANSGELIIRSNGQVIQPGQPLFRRGEPVSGTSSRKHRAERRAR